MKKRMMMTILASALLAGSLLATDAQARGGGGGGGHMGGGGGHMGGGFGGHVGGFGGHVGGLGGHQGGATGGRVSGLEDSHIGPGTRTGSLGFGSRHHMAHRYGGFYDDDGLYDDGLGCSNLDYPYVHHHWLPSCS
ncbi:MAG: hypothetical protein QOE39_4690 [Bradyrhizobium sp.]|jgi:hypothetical protein|nr:hypothetical protein [Bradyrhizobium sp.]